MQLALALKALGGDQYGGEEISRVERFFATRWEARAAPSAFAV